MFSVVILIFIVCWAPYHIYFIYSYHYPSITRKAYIGHIYLFFYWLAMANTCVNPIIYYWMNARFRAYFKQILCCTSRKIRIPSWSEISTKVKRLSDFENTTKVVQQESQGQGRCKCDEKPPNIHKNQETNTDTVLRIEADTAPEINITHRSEVLI